MRETVEDPVAERQGVGARRRGDVDADGIHLRACSDRYPASSGLITDFIIVGSGIAGLRAAIALAPVGRVLVLTKAEPRKQHGLRAGRHRGRDRRR